MKHPLTQHDPVLKTTMNNQSREFSEFMKLRLIDLLVYRYILLHFLR